MKTTIKLILAAILVTASAFADAKSPFEIPRMYNANKPHPMTGVWEITYVPYGTRAYVVSNDGSVKWDNGDKKRSGKLIAENGGFSITFQDGWFERIAWADDRCTTTIHKKPDGAALGLKPNFVGTGTRTKAIPPPTQ